MTDIIIPVRTPILPTANVELKFALRGIEKHIADAGRVFIIGHCPEWLDLNNLTIIPYKELNWFKSLTRNIHEKIKLACNRSDVSDQFLFMNDDHFLLENVKAATYPLYHGSVEFGGRGQYMKATVPDTINVIKSQGHTVIYNYDVHTPIVFDKAKYLEHVATLNWKKDFGYCIKTSYVYLSGQQQEGVPFDDLKLGLECENVAEVERRVGHRHIFSTADGAFKSMRDDTGIHTNPLYRYMETLFPDKSKYEI